MNYIIFNNTIIVSDGKKTKVLERNSNLNAAVSSIDMANVCVVDVDVMVASAIEVPVEKKDSILVRKFNELYQNEPYVIQDERLDHNLFLVMGIKEQKVKEVYSFLQPQRVQNFIPYALALRNYLLKKTVDLARGVVFVDDFGPERLLTVFEGMKFSRTRVISINETDILPEIKRSQIDFAKKNEEYLTKRNSDFLIIVNNKKLAQELSQNKDRPQIEFLDVSYPAIEGLKEENSEIKFRLPEEIRQKRKKLEFERNVRTALVSFGLIGVGMLYLLFNRIELEIDQHRFERDKQKSQELGGELTLLDRHIYREDLRKQKSLNYAVAYLFALNLIPQTYEVTAFKFTKGDRWDFELTLFSQTGDTYDDIPRRGILRDAQVKDIYVNNQPAKHLRISI
ncbi:MAG: hypothetical protein KGJ11_00245 [Candidatus Omnitrophica bacterium]|nr:hypothetical protein [Candidatus Omnitrophota bacterium]